MTIRETIARFLMRPQYERVNRLADVLVEEYSRRPYMYDRSPESLIRQLGEVDSHLVDLLLRQIRETEIGTTTDETARGAAVKESRTLYLNDVITQNIIDLWTDYSSGTSATIVPRDESAIEVWNEFWDAGRNAYVLGDREISTLSTDILTDGELFFLFFVSRADGEATVRTIPTEQIKEIVCDPEDNKVPVYYKREFVPDPGSAVPATIYYRDWRASDKEVERVKLPEGAIKVEFVKGDGISGTDVVVLHAAFRKRNGRGWPLMTAGAPWSRAYRNFLQDRAAVSRAVSTYVDKLTVKGGSRAVDFVRSTLESSLTNTTGSGYETNPVPAAGASWIQNEAVDRQRMPLATGAADAEKDGHPLLAQAGLAGRIFPHYLGRGEAFRLATATALEEPTRRAFNRYQTFWASIWRDMVKLVLTMKGKYGGMTFETYDADVNTDSIVQVDLDKIASLIESLTGMVDSFVLSGKVANKVGEQLLRVALQTLGIGNVEELFETEAAEAFQEFKPGMGLEEIRGEYIEKLSAAMNDYLVSEKPITAFRNAFRRAVNDAFNLAYVAGYADAGGATEEMEPDDAAWIQARIEAEIGYADLLFQDLKALRGEEDAPVFVEARSQGYANTLDSIYLEGKLRGDKNKMVTWQIGQTEQHCKTCLKLNGQRHSIKWFLKRGYIPREPGSATLECGGYHCDCGLYTDKGEDYTYVR